MLRQDIITACQHILAAIEKSGLADLMERWRQSPPSEGRLRGRDLLHCYVEYMIYSSKYFGENEKKILGIFKLEYLEDKEWWGVFVDSQEKSERAPLDNIGLIFSTIRFTLEQLPKVIDLIHRTRNKCSNTEYLKHFLQIAPECSCLFL